MSKVIYIPVGARPPLAVELPETLEGKQRLVGGYLESLSMTDKLDMWINEEGLLQELSLNVVASMVASSFLGRIVEIYGPVFLAEVDSEGNMLGLPADRIKVFEAMVADTCRRTGTPRGQDYV